MDYEEFRSTDGYFYVIYKSINLINGNFYIGKHKTKDLNDSYFGSGIRISYAIKKYGIENFKKEYLYFFNNENDCYNKEKEIVNESLLQDEKCYNLNLGGEGSWHKAQLKLKFLFENKDYALKHGLKVKEYYKNLSEEEKLKISEKHSRTLIEKYKNDPLYRKKISDNKREYHAKTNYQRGNKNSQFGTCWIHNNKESKKIKKEELSDFLKNGWIKGRKIKF